MDFREYSFKILLDLGHKSLKLLRVGRLLWHITQAAQLHFAFAGVFKAGAGRIYITRRRGVTLMEVRDNGRGISDEQINNPRTMGLLGMRERALVLGGEVRVTPAPRHGTRLLVILPDAERA